MFRFLVLIIVICVALTAATDSHIRHSADPCDSTTNGLIDGERLEYDIYYNYGFVWLSAGEVVFTTSQDGDHYLVEVTGKTHPAYSRVFKVDDYFATQIDKHTGLPDYFVRRVHEGKYRKYDSLAFDQQHFRAVSYVGKTRADVKEQRMDFTTCMHDMLSIVYQVRALNFDTITVGTSVPYEVAFDGETYDLAMLFKGIQRKRIKKLGHRDTYVVEPQVVAGAVFDEETTMTLYTTTDQLKVPLLVESPVSIGSVKAVLRSLESVSYK
jgi:hypothetical protein